MFVDKAEIVIKAGKGGDGSVSFRREKYVPDGGPDGGDGGHGGHIIAQVDSGMRTLMDFRYKTQYDAPSGEHGRKKNQYGKKGENLILKVPPGTVIRDKDTGRIIADLVDPEDEKIIAKGGRGGRGNTHFKSSTRRTPDYAEQGYYGEEKTIILELKMLADVGLVGFPNVGKSTLLSQVTKAKPKIANYHFTTLFPNLGVVEVVKGKSFVLADIPGLIEGAHEGVGLGHDFLRHVERTKLILHVVDLSGLEGRDPLEDFDKINEELEKYSSKLASRHQIVAANKADLLFEEDQKTAFLAEMERRGIETFIISAATGEGVEELMKRVSFALDEVEEVILYEEEDFIIDDDLGIDNQHEITFSQDGDVYVVEGRGMERLYYSTNFESVDSLRRFQNILNQRGVFDTLREMGIEDGDVVRVFDLEFEYYE